MLSMSRMHVCLSCSRPMKEKKKKRRRRKPEELFIDIRVAIVNQALKGWPTSVYLRLPPFTNMRVLT